MAKIFMSYARDDADQGFAIELARLLEERGVSVFDEKRDLRPGEAWPDAIRDAIEKSAAIVVLIPALNASNRNNVWVEIGVAKALGKRVLAVLPPHRRSSAGEMPTDIAGLIIVDAGERPLDRIADTLVQAAA